MRSKTMVEQTVMKRLVKALLDMIIFIENQIPKGS